MGSVETQLAWVRLVKMKLLIFLFVAVLGVTLAVAQEKGFSNLLFDPFELVNRIDSQGSSFPKTFVAKKKLFDLESFTFKPLTVTTTRKPRRRIKTSRPRPRPTTQKPTTTTEITTLKPLTTREPEATTVVEIKTTEVPAVVEIKTTEVPESNNEIDVETKKPKKSQLNTSDRDWIKSIRRRTTRRTTTSTTTTTTTTTTATTTITTTPAPTT